MDEEHARTPHLEVARILDVKVEPLGPGRGQEREVAQTEHGVRHLGGVGHGHRCGVPGGQVAELIRAGGAQFVDAQLRGGVGGEGGDGDEQQEERTHKGRGRDSYPALEGSQRSDADQDNAWA